MGTRGRRSRSDRAAVPDAACGPDPRGGGGDAVSTKRDLRTLGPRRPEGSRSEAVSRGDERSQLALEVECYRLKKYIGAYAAAVGGVDAVVFTAGVGESSALHREKSCEGLGFLGIRLDEERNATAVGRAGESEISTPDSEVKVFVIPTDEELVMVEDAHAIFEGRFKVHTEFEYSFEKRDFVPSYLRFE